MPVVAGRLAVKPPERLKISVARSFQAYGILKNVSKCLHLDHKFWFVAPFEKM